MLGFILCVVGFVFFFHWLIPEAAPLLTTKDYRKEQATVFHYVALGDSLTEGVGDSTNQGGFVPLLSQQLTNQYGYQVEAVNYGVAGNTSKQILKRMQETPEIVASLKEADLLTLTVGGNDLRQVILSNILDLNIQSFDKPSKAYSKRLVQIVEEARKANPDLLIYVLGIYNPYYLYFPDMTDMQIIVNNWNQVTEATLADFEGVYFVPINDLLYQGIDGQSGIAQPNETNQTVNNLLYKEDNFHPNHTGYEIMKQAVWEKINETSPNW